MKQLFRPLPNLIHTLTAMYKTLKREWKPLPAPGQAPPFRGEPVLRLDHQGETSCTVCHACAHACPTQCLRVVSDDKQPALALDRERCMYCGICVRVCPVNALALSCDVQILGRRRS